MSEPELLEAIHRSLTTLETDTATLAKAQVQLEEFFRETLAQLKKNNELLEGLCTYLSVKPEDVRRYAQG